MPNLAKIGFLFLWLLLSCSTSRSDKYLGPLQDRSVLIEGRMFQWTVTQAGPDQTFNTNDDFHFNNEIVVPVGTRLKLQLKSVDVFHGFFLPSLKFHRRLLPGILTEDILEVRRIGSFPFACSEVCGVGHGKMMGRLRVLTPEDYDSWLRAQSSKNAMVPSG